MIFSSSCINLIQPTNLTDWRLCRLYQIDYYIRSSARLILLNWSWKQLIQFWVDFQTSLRTRKDFFKKQFMKSWHASANFENTSKETDPAGGWFWLKVSPAEYQLKIIWGYELNKLLSITFYHTWAWTTAKFNGSCVSCSQIQLKNQQPKILSKTGYEAMLYKIVFKNQLSLSGFDQISTATDLI